MTVSRLLAETNSRELSEWMAYFNYEAAQDKKGNDAESLKAKFASLLPNKKNENSKHKK